MRRFKLKAGTHVEDGKTYKAGDVVASHRDLATAFKEKFEDLGEAETTRPVKPATKPWTPPQQPVGDVPENAAESQEADEPQASRPAKPAKSTKPAPNKSSGRTGDGWDDEAKKV